VSRKITGAILDENKALSKLVQAGDEQALLAALTAAFSV
jgi:hypothetical protein